MRANYEGGNYGYGHAKKELLGLLLEKYSEERNLFNYFMENENELEQKLKEGEQKAKAIADEVLLRVRKNIGF
jgi:tryptophanyl-tRNA synthetase